MNFQNKIEGIVASHSVRLRIIYIAPQTLRAEEDFVVRLLSRLSDIRMHCVSCELKLLQFGFNVRLKALSLPPALFYLDEKSGSFYSSDFKSH